MKHTSAESTAQLNPNQGKKKLQIAATFVAASVLLGACGSNDEDSENAASSSNSATSSSSAAASSSSSESSSSVAESSSAAETETTTQQAAEDANNGSGAQQAAPAPAPVNQDEVAIRSLVLGLNNVNTLREYMEYIPLHTCSRVVNSAGGWESFDFSSLDPDLQSQIEAEVTNTQVDDVTDIVVNGDTATANIVSTTAGEGTTTEPMTFERENNSWTFCQ